MATCPPSFQYLENLIAWGTAQELDDSRHLSGRNGDEPLVFTVVADRRRGGSEVLSVDVKRACAIHPGPQGPPIGSTVFIAQDNAPSGPSRRHGKDPFSSFDQAFAPQVYPLRVMLRSSL